MTSRIPSILLSVCILLASACPRESAPPPEPPAPAPWIELFPGEEWNDLPEGEGEMWSGTVRYFPGNGQPSFVMRYNPYRLEDSAGSLTDIYCGGSDELAPFIGLPVDIEGRLDTVEVEGRVFVEIRPARIRPVLREAD